MRYGRRSSSTAASRVSPATGSSMRSSWPSGSPTAPLPVRWPVMYQTWSWLSFLHWSYPLEVVARLLPGSLRPDSFDGRAWVGLTPFVLEDLRTPVGPALPWCTSFPETNLRTYVRGPDGRDGLWFFSLDAARLEPVLVARGPDPDQRPAPAPARLTGSRPVSVLGGFRPTDLLGVAWNAVKAVK